MTTLEAQAQNQDRTRIRHSPFQLPMMAAAFVVSLKQLVEAWLYLAAQLTGVSGWGQALISNWANVTTSAVSIVCVLAGFGLIAGVRGLGGRVLGACLGGVAILLGIAALAPIVLPVTQHASRAPFSVSEVAGREKPQMNAAAPVQTPAPSVGAEASEQPHAGAGASEQPHAGAAGDERFEKCLAAAVQASPVDASQAAARCVEEK